MIYIVIATDTYGWRILGCYKRYTLAKCRLDEFVSKSSGWVGMSEDFYTKESGEEVKITGEYLI